MKPISICQKSKNSFQSGDSKKNEEWFGLVNDKDGTFGFEKFNEKYFIGENKIYRMKENLAKHISHNMNMNIVKFTC